MTDAERALLRAIKTRLDVANQTYGDCYRTHAPKRELLEAGAAATAISNELRLWLHENGIHDIFMLR